MCNIFLDTSVGHRERVHGTLVGHRALLHELGLGVANGMGVLDDSVIVTNSKVGYVLNSFLYSAENAVVSEPVEESGQFILNYF